jgi:hypothetical protein
MDHAGQARVTDRIANLDGHALAGLPVEHHLLPRAGMPLPYKLVPGQRQEVVVEKEGELGARIEHELPRRPSTAPSIRMCPLNR